MTPTTITILAVAAYFAVGYAASVGVYARMAPKARRYDLFGPREAAGYVFVVWPAILAAVVLWKAGKVATRPHRYFAALVKKLNTPAPVQVSGAFAGGGAKHGWRIESCDIKPSGVKMNIGPGILGTGICRSALEDHGEPELMARPPKWTCDCEGCQESRRRAGYAESW